MRIKILTLCLFAGAIVGCSTNETKKCPIDQNGYPQCSSMEEVYQNAMNEEGDNLSVLNRVSTKVEDDANYPGEDNSGQKALMVKHLRMARSPQEHPYESKPVWIPEKVHRVWFAPWKDEYKNLHSAESVYFTTKGYWNYGTLNETGVAGQSMMQPLTPDDLGYSPDYSEQSQDGKKHVNPEVTVFGGSK